MSETAPTKSPSAADRHPRAMVGGFPTLPVTRDGLADLMVEDCLSARAAGSAWLPKLVFSSNGQGIALAGQDPAFAAVMGKADIVHADGMSVVYASRMTAHPCPERIVTTDFFHNAARAAEKSGLKFFMMGAKDEQNAAACATIQAMYPRLQIVGRQHGYFKDAENDAVCARIRESGADVLWVALGKPRQEFWSVANQAKLGGVGWVKTCGGLYSYLAGDVSRAPGWMQNLGLEWAYRGLLEPKRLGWRYLTTNPYATYRLVRYTSRSGGRKLAR